MSWASIVILGILSHILVINASGSRVTAKHMISFLALLIIISLATIDIIKHHGGNV